MFDLLANAVRLAKDTVTLPVSVAADIVTMGGEMTERRESYTGTKLRRMGRDAKDLADDIAG